MLRRKVEVTLELEVEIDTNLDPVEEQESIRDIVEDGLKIRSMDRPNEVEFDSDDVFLRVIGVGDRLSIGDITWDENGR